MNYQKIYNSLIDRAKHRKTFEGYKEKHHIIPKGLGGSNDDNNIVELTAREHFIAHRLLVKIHPNNGKMLHALFMMSKRKGYTNRDYGYLREEYGKKLSQDKLRSLRISQSLKNKPKSKEHIENWFNSRKKGGGWVCSESRKERQRIQMVGAGNHMFGKTHNEEAKRKIREANIKKIECIHCGKEGGIAIMKRWHFDKCKQKP